MQLEMKIVNDDVLNKLKQAGSVFEEAAGAFLKKSGLMVVSIAGQKAPRDKGTLGSSISAGEVKKTAGTLEIPVGTNVDYAPHHEFGTGIYGKNNAPITPKRAKMLRFVIKGGQVVYARSVKGVPAKKFMQQGIEFVEQNVETAFAEADKIIQRKL